MIQIPEPGTGLCPATALEPRIEALLFVAQEPLPLKRSAVTVGAETVVVRGALRRL